MEPNKNINEPFQLVLPVPMPTWNRVLAMHYWERKKLRDWLHRAVSVCIKYGDGWPIVTISTEKLSLMDCDIAAYYAMIRPSTSKKSGSRKKKVSTKKNERSLK